MLVSTAHRRCWRVLHCQCVCSSVINQCEQLMRREKDERSAGKEFSRVSHPSRRVLNDVDHSVRYFLANAAGDH